LVSVFICVAIRFGAIQEEGNRDDLRTGCGQR
jgi:hypothetical protein